MHRAKKSLIEILTLALFIISGSRNMCLAQKDPIRDSLLFLMQIVKDDTNKVNVLNDLSFHLIHTTMHADGKKYAEDGLILAEKIHFSKGIADAYNNIGIFYKNQANYAEALKQYGYSLKIYEEIGNKRGIANSYIEIGNVYNEQGGFTEALRNYTAALKINEEIGNKIGIASSYNNIGNICNKQGNYAEALKNYLFSLKISEEIGIKSRIATSYNNIGNIYKNQGNNSEALKYSMVSLKLRTELGDKKGIANSYSNIGNIYRDLGEYAEALKNHQLSLKIKEEIGDKKGSGISFNSIGNIYFYQGNYSEALKYFQASLKIKEEIGDKNGIANTHLNIGIVNNNQGNYFEALKNFQASLVICNEIKDQKGIAHNKINLGQLYIKLNKLDEARSYLMNGLALSIKLGIKNGIKDAYQGLTELDSTTGNYQQSLEHYKLYTLYKDSLFHESNNKAITEIKAKFETEKKDKEIQQLENEKQIRDLELKVHQEALHRIELERAKILTENLLNLKQVDLLANEKRLQQLDIEKNKIELAIQKAESNRKQDQLVILNKEGEIQKLEIKKQRVIKNGLIFGVFALVFFGLFGYNYYITRQQLKLQTLRNRIATDLHDDVGSTLSSISIFSEMARQQSKEVIPMLDTIDESSQKMLDAMGDIVWTIHPENDQFEKIILRMRSFAYNLLGARQIDFTFETDEQISQLRLPMDVRKNLYLIFKEASNNLVKYSEANQAHYSIKREFKTLEMVVRDNGKGFDTSIITEGNGIRNMKRRAQEIGANLSIASQPGSGTTIHLKLAI